ncbi:MAG TPA: DUF1349 domain-containing protein, partial [Streptosporangiaceae bacterium]
MKWLNEPASWQRMGDVLSVSVDPGTDFWRETGYGYIHDSGHVYGEEHEGDVDVSVSVRGAFGAQYDQAGIMLRVDERVWLKTGVEFFEGRPRLSTVLTLGRSSWMVTDLPEWMEEISLLASRRGDAVEVRYIVGGGPAELAALVYLPPGRDVLAGIMCAAPEGPGFRVSFSDLQIERGWSVRLAKMAAERREAAAAGGAAAGGAAAGAVAVGDAGPAGELGDDDTLRWAAAPPPDADPRWAGEPPPDADPRWAGEPASNGASDWTVTLPADSDARWSAPGESNGSQWRESGPDPGTQWFSGSGEAEDTGWASGPPGAAAPEPSGEQDSAPAWSGEPQDAPSPSWSIDSDRDEPAAEGAAEPVDDSAPDSAGESGEDREPSWSADSGPLPTSESRHDSGPL